MSTATGVFDVREYVDDENGKILLEDIENRLAELLEMREEFESEGDKLDEDEATELGELQTFMADIKRAFPATREELTIVMDEDHVRYVRWAAEEFDGIGPDNVGDYVEWDEYAKDRLHNWKSFELGGRQVLVSDNA